MYAALPILAGLLYQLGQFLLLATTRQIACTSFDHRDTEPLREVMDV